MSTTRRAPVIILLMGEIGSGRSSFINTAAGEIVTQVGHELEACTTTVNHFSVQHPRKYRREVHFVDTPGFNNPSKDDGMILNEIIDWLEKRSHPNDQFGGIIYLYDLSQTKDASIGRTVMKLKAEPLNRVILTAWGKDSNLETRLKLIGERVQIQHYKTSEDSAWGIVDTILDMGTIQVGTIRDELVRISNQLPKEVPKPTMRLGNPPVIILLMGEIGAGKSSFINTAAGEIVTRVGHGWEACTTTVNHFSVQHPREYRREVHFVDTPGFNDPSKGDGVILNEIIDWLKTRSHPNDQFGGIIYMYDLSQAQEVANRKTVMKLKPEPLSRVVLTTLGREGSTLETQLRRITGDRVQIQRFTDSKDSAWAIVDTILGMGTIQVGTISDELARISSQLPKEVSKPTNLPVIILLMGEIGAGKSSFINTAAGEIVTQVGHDLGPCTTTVNHFSVQHPKYEREIHFVDTPGFNDPSKGDGMILNEITDWLKKRSYPNDQFGGIIYMYDLSQAQEVANRKTVMRLKEPEPLSRVILTTLGMEGSNLETQLKHLTGERMQIRPFTGSKDSAWMIVDTILDMGSIQVDIIHDELARISGRKVPINLGIITRRLNLFFANLFGFTV